MIHADYTAGTAVYGVIGDPVSHSFSPIIHNTIARELGDDISYTAFHVLPSQLENAIRGAYALGIQGLNVTIPHKHEVIPFLSHTDAAALEAGAVNTLCYTPNGYHGYNTDIPGVLQTLYANGVSLSGATCIVLGGGGSARAAVVALSRGGAKRIYLANRTIEKALALADEMRTLYETEICVIPQAEIGDIPSADVLVQTTSAGFGVQKELSPVADALFCKRVATVFDIIYTPWETMLLRDARACGAQCLNGFDMLVYQAIASYEIWRGITIDDSLAVRLKQELGDYYRKHRKNNRE